MTERSPVAPSTMHGMMHAARELIFRTDIAAPFAVLRPTLIYGAGDPHSGYGPNRFRRQAAKGEPILIFGEGEEKRDHVAVEDVARLAVLILSAAAPARSMPSPASRRRSTILRRWSRRISRRRPKSSRSRGPGRARICCTASSISAIAIRRSPISISSASPTGLPGSIASLPAKETQ